MMTSCGVVAGIRTGAVFAAGPRGYRRRPSFGTVACDLPPGTYGRIPQRGHGGKRGHAPGGVWLVVQESQPAQTEHPVSHPSGAGRLRPDSRGLAAAGLSVRTPGAVVWNGDR